MKKILLLGATGRTGQLTLDYALKSDYEVVALVRNPSKITINSEKLTLIGGTPSNPQDISIAMKGCDAVISTMNNNRASDSPFAKPLNDEDFMTKIMTSCVDAMNAEGIRRIVVMTALGAGDSFDYSPWILKLLIRKTNLGIAYRDHEGQEKVLRESELDWTVARPVGLNDKPNTKKLCADYGRPDKISMMIERNKVAKFLVDCLQDTASFGKAAALYESKV